MPNDPMTPFGMALLDYYQGCTDAAIICRRDDGLETVLPVNIFYKDQNEFSEIEQKALGLCKGRVLDAGAGTGRHTLYLMQKGFDTFSVDISHEATAIMKMRGIKNVACGNIFDFQEGGFDTILLLLHGIGMTGTIEGFRRFLLHARELLKPDGCIIFDSLDVRCTNEKSNLDYLERNKNINRYSGEIQMQFEYKGFTGAPVSWLHIDPETMKDLSSSLGWNNEIMHRESSGDYLVRLY
ncbi:MAG TPA: class I SAM-dependent methyltransferase [Bacteroidales bacterium]|nr:class I SAM-dependent methyltransferase [Bacteroidales bacterium]